MRAFLRFVWHGRRPHPARSDEQIAYFRLYGAYSPQGLR